MSITEPDNPTLFSATDVIRSMTEQKRGSPAQVALGVLMDGLVVLDELHNSSQNPEPHGLISPAMVLIGSDGIVRLKAPDEERRKLREMSNVTARADAPYLAPEVLKGNPPTPASDIYGLGAVTYALLTGRAPHGDDPTVAAYRALTLRPPFMGKVRPDLPAPLASLVHRMLETHDARRPKTAADLLSEVTKVATDEGLLAARATVGQWTVEAITKLASAPTEPPPAPTDPVVLEPHGDTSEHATDDLRITAPTEPLVLGTTPVQRSVSEVSGHWVQAHAEDIRLIDVRDPSDFKGSHGHVMNAESVPAEQLVSAAKRWTPSELIVLVCSDGNQSRHAAHLMMDLGFANVSTLEGGLSRWHADGRPVRLHRRALRKHLDEG